MSGVGSSINSRATSVSFVQCDACGELSPRCSTHCFICQFPLAPPPSSPVASAAAARQQRQSAVVHVDLTDTTSSSVSSSGTKELKKKSDHDEDDADDDDKTIVELLDDSDDEDDRKPPAAKRQCIRPRNAKLEALDAAMARKMQQEEQEALEARKAKEERAMLQGESGRAFLLVQQVLAAFEQVMKQHQQEQQQKKPTTEIEKEEEEEEEDDSHSLDSDAATCGGARRSRRSKRKDTTQALDYGSLIQTVGRDDAVFLAEKLMTCIREFQTKGISTQVEIAYHYTNREKLQSIRQDGLLSAGDDSKAVQAHGAYFGKGVYTGNNPYAFRPYGDTGLLLAIIKGNTHVLKSSSQLDTVPADTNTVIANKFKCKHSNKVNCQCNLGMNEIVLRDSRQVLPLIRFSKQIMAQTTSASLEHPGHQLLFRLHLKMQQVLHQFFQQQPSQDAAELPTNFIIPHPRMMQALYAKRSSGRRLPAMLPPPPPNTSNATTTTTGQQQQQQNFPSRAAAAAASASAQPSAAPNVTCTTHRHAINGSTTRTWIRSAFTNRHHHHPIQRPIPSPPTRPALVHVHGHAHAGPNHSTPPTITTTTTAAAVMPPPRKFPPTVAALPPPPGYNTLQQQTGGQQQQQRRRRRVGFRLPPTPPNTNATATIGNKRTYAQHAGTTTSPASLKQPPSYSLAAAPSSTSNSNHPTTTTATAQAPFPFTASTQHASPQPQPPTLPPWLVNANPQQQQTVQATTPSALPSSPPMQQTRAATISQQAPTQQQPAHPTPPTANAQQSSQPQPRQPPGAPNRRGRRRVHFTHPYYFNLCLTLLGMMAVISTTTTVTVRAQSTCNFNNDNCPYQFDGECDAGVYCSQGSDCFDCDLCAGFNLDCGLCTAAGCSWCPYDATCLGSPVGQAVWDLHPLRQPGCRLESDWQADCTTNPNNVFSDPLYSAMQWMYTLIKVEEVWKQNITGAGIHVRVNDDGVDATHPEFVNHFDVANSCEIYLPNPLAPDDNHGTACASLIAGAKDNGVCAVGIAPDATLSACNNFVDPQFAGLEAATQLFMTKLDVVDVISNSWGPTPCTKLPTADGAQARQAANICPFQVDAPDSPCQACGGATTFDKTVPECEPAIIKYCSTKYELDPVACGEYLDLYVTCSFHTLSQGNEEGFPQVMAQGRGGKGPIITFAGGNDYHLGVDANSDGMVNSRYTIGVGAVGKDGLHASYSTTGAAIFVSAPGGDREALSNNIVAKPGGGCHDITVGTSFATPVVSGVSALILQANPNLTWRDVQAIIQETSQRVDFTDPSWVVNSVGVSHSYKYGFGLIDAAAAVFTAKQWVNWGPEKQIMVESGTIDVKILDNTASPNGALAVLTITEQDVITATGVNNIQLESVVVYLELVHGSRGDVKITLTSPGGTPSILAPSKRPENSILDASQRWKLMTLRSWGENPVGSWTLEIADERAGLISDCVDRTWQATSDGFNWGCNDFTLITDCSDPVQVSPSLQLTEFNGLTIFDACCACGGGVNAAALDQRLVSWRMIAYGHEFRATTAPETPQATPAPTGTTTTTPATQIPTSANQTGPPGNATTNAPSAQTANPAVTTVPAPTTQTPGLPPVDSASCAYRSDTCPVHIQFDHECDEALAGCPDCFDCDRCQAYSYDCANCVANGCVWCPGDAICLSVALDAAYWATYNGQVSSSCPTATDWRNTCDVNPSNVFADPLYDSMAWMYRLINLESVWREGVTGAGVHVRVNDNGVDGNHVEFSSKFDIANSCTDFLPATAADDHGTASASIIAASNNSDCAVGVAPGATLSACIVPLDNDAAEAQIFLEKLQVVDISSNSYGPNTCVNNLAPNRNLQQLPCPFSQNYDLSPCDVCGGAFGQTLTNECLQAVAQYCSRYYEVDKEACIDYMDFFVSCYYHFLPTVLHDAWVRTITEGRNGKGIIYVVSAGNLYNIRENSNANGMLNSRFTMAIGAVGKDGLHASYSTTGSSVFLSAPGGDLENVSNNIVAKPFGGCHDITVGTSFSAPVVSGVVALMLSVANGLTWRDVQGVLASTAQVVDATDTSWTTNAAGIRFSNKYGFGLVDAAAAVAASRTWQNWGPEVQIVGEAGELNVVMPDLAQFNVTMSVSDPRNLKIESVVVFLDLPHQSRGDLKLSIVSPGGTESVLAEGNRPLNQQLAAEERWKFLTYAAWGESPVGEWVLKVADESPGILSPCVDFNWGTEQDGATYTCDTLKNFGVPDCTLFDQAIVTAVFEGRTGLQSCCFCGGGQNLTSVTNVLKSWRMLIYSHDADVTPAPVATVVPSTSPPVAPGVTQAPVPARPTVSAPVPLSTAIVMTTAPGVTRPWITSGSTSDQAPTSLGQLRKWQTVFVLLAASMASTFFLLEIFN